ncbi:rust resistance kinase Lr10-like isoform X2 [Lotus japonicus]|uniref:rust resistance kinase Lr10-like isoform X2 n=1 Tax=Lotus japonicus TaxID=34305 RepID=UPI002585EF98|nr:rust resistance kinase Lr10-like isoform X2 [Lotus japonicus]
MSICLVKMFSCFGLLLFMLCFNVVTVELALGNDIDTDIANCPDLSCGNQVIRFPFRILDRHPTTCGYPGFDLSCSSKNNTEIELPHPVKLNVKNIDYRHQTIELSDPYGCLPKQLQYLAPSASQFQFQQGGYHFFNCSVTNKGSLLDYSYLVPCLNTLGSQVYAVPSSTLMEDLPLSFCTKMFNISYNPFDFQTDQDYILRLTWSKPNCQQCESKGRRCVWNNHAANNGIYCFSDHKGSVLGSLFFMLLTAAVYHVYDIYRLRKEKEAMFVKFLQDYRALKPTRYSYVEIKRITKNFEHKLGEGAFGTVFKGNISKEISIAVKILNISHGNGEEFINEVSTMGRIHHVNIVRMVGFCADGFNRALVYEFLPNGSLQKFINSPDNRQNFLGWKRLYEIALGIAKGIEYLYQGCNQRILHFDIKPQNVLLDHNFAPKICDFGLAKLCSRDQSIVSMTAARGTLGYIAPEVFSRNFGNVSDKSDVYSYGMMLLETIGGRKITEDMEENTSHVYYPEWIHNLLEEHEEMRIHIQEEGDSKIARKLAIVGLWCIQWYAMNRPSMQMVVQMLEGDVETAPIPPNPFTSSAGARPRRTIAIMGVAARQLTKDLDVIQE